MVRVLLYTYFPFYATHLGGGLQNGMRSLVSALNKYADIQIEVVCPYSNLHPFADDVKVFPVIEDMEVNGRTPMSLWNDLQKIHELEHNADLIWVVDRCFPVYTEKPILFSMFTVCYERD